MFRRKNGSALAQYAIVIALVSVAVATGYLLFGKTIVSCLTDFSNALSDNSAAIAANTSTTTSSSTSGSTSTAITSPPSTTLLDASSLGGNPGDPQISCTDGMCSIDYGTHIFNGIPEDFSGFVETSGSTAGTDVVLAILDDIVQAAEEGKIEMSTDELEKIRLLAEKGHALANGERSLEDFILNGDITTLVGSAITTSGERSHVDMEAEVLALCEGEQFSNALSAFKSYDETQMDPVIKDMVATLADQIQYLYEDFDSRTSLMNWTTPVDEETAQAAYISFFASHEVSGLSNLNSTIICGVGNGDDTGISCDP